MSLLLCQQIMEKMKHIEAGYDQLLDTWERRQEDYKNILDSLIFIRDAEQAEMWIASQEAFIGSEDVGVSFVISYIEYIIYGFILWHVLVNATCVLKHQ